MTTAAIGPNGEVMLSLADGDKQKTVEDQQLAVLINLKHDAADRTGDREKIENLEKTVEEVELDKKGTTRKTVTDAWAVPRQIPDGPHAGRWYIPVPADDALRNERDPKTGAESDKTHPSWKNAEIVERDPAWFPDPIVT